MSKASWNVDKYKTEHESDEHWELRRKFLITHQDTLPEDELVCMAQVFTNVEFLGCRYPDETMIRVAELAKGVVEEFREKKKDTLKRTFVAASDAASSKVKGLGRPTANKEDGDAPTPAKRSFVAATPEPPAKMHGGLKPNGEGKLSRFIVVLVPGQNDAATVTNSVNSNKLGKDSKFETIKDETFGQYKSTYYLNGEEFSTAEGTSMKAAQQLAASNALAKLRKQCYTLVLKDRLGGGETVNTSDIDNKPVVSESVLDEKNVGAKLMRLMGWGGAGLGSAGQGRVEPVKARTCVGRSGIGTQAVEGNAFREAVRKYLKDWVYQSSPFAELVFDAEFTKEQRAIIHKLSASFNLKSQSFGKLSNRQLVLSKKVASIWEIAEEIERTGGNNRKYTLLPPDAEDSSAKFSQPDNLNSASTLIQIEPSNPVRTDPFQ